MMRRLWLACCVLLSALIGSAPVTLIGGIWMGSWRLIGISVVLGFCALFASLAFNDWTPPERNLPRADRKRLRDESRRIRLEKALAELEREAGL